MGGRAESTGWTSSLLSFLPTCPADLLHWRCVAQWSGHWAPLRGANCFASLSLSPWGSKGAVGCVSNTAYNEGSLESAHSHLLPGPSWEPRGIIPNPWRPFPHVLPNTSRCHSFFPFAILLWLGTTHQGIYRGAAWALVWNGGIKPALNTALPSLPKQFIWECLFSS